MSKKQVISAKIVHDVRVLQPKYVSKARMFAVTEFNSTGKQVIHWSINIEEANKKFQSLKSAV